MSVQEETPRYEIKLTKKRFFAYLNEYLDNWYEGQTLFINVYKSDVLEELLKEYATLFNSENRETYEFCFRYSKFHECYNIDIHSIVNMPLEVDEEDVDEEIEYTIITNCAETDFVNHYTSL